MDKRGITAAEAARQLRRPDGEDGVKMGVQMNKSNRLMYEMTLEFLALRAGDRILEIGMGNGAFIPDLFVKEPTLKYTGLDMSDCMIAAAAGINAERMQTGHVDLHLGTTEEMTFAPGAFTKVFCVNVLYFWDNPAAALQAIHRVLEPGGELVLAFRSKQTMEQLPFVDHGFTLYDIAAAKTLLEKNGFIMSAVITAVEPPKMAADGSLLVQLENICMRGVKN
jgi:SAM-dependent methyltransferase